MNDDFLHRIRVDPPPRFIATLKARLVRLEQGMQPRPVWRRGFFLGSLIAATALASGLFLARRMYDVSSSAVPSSPSPSVSSPNVDDRPRAVSPLPAGQAQSSVVTPHPDEAVKSSRVPGQIVIGATVAIAPTIKMATGFMQRNMNVNPPFSEPAFSIMSENAAIPALCDSDNPVDIVVMNRRVRPGELDACHRQNRHIAEVKLGYEAVVLVRSKIYDELKLDSRSIFLALAREIPDPLHPEDLIKNPNVTWDQVNPALPSERIDVSGPALSSETGIAFRDLVLKRGCLAIPTIAAMKETDPDRFEEICGTVRTDGVYRAGEGDMPAQRAGGSPFDLIGYLQSNPEAIALMNAEAIGIPGSREAQDSSFATSSLDGVVPSRSAIYSGAYPGARIVYLYTNTAHPQIRYFVRALWSAVNDGHDPTLISVDVGDRNLLQQMMTLPDLNL
jgi:ABC-type phosphate transport system substrate-binding protein